MLKIILLLFVATVSFSQPKSQEHYKYISVAIDVRNATLGSSPTNHKPELDILYQAGIVSQNIEVNIGYESFNAICFRKYTFGVGYHFPLYGYVFGRQIKTVFIPSIEPTLIDRWGALWQTTSSHLTIGGNLALRWKLTDKFGAELLCNALPRIDLKARWPTVNPTIPMRYSNYVKIIYLF